MYKGLIIFGIIALLGVGFWMVFMNNSIIENNNIVKVIGHRGAGGLAPENTLSAIQKGIDLEVDMLEIDVQRSKDNIIIVLHDRSIDRTTTGKGKARDLSYQEIRNEQISINGQITKNDYVPTLEEVIQLVNGKTKLLIEVKKGHGYYPNIEEEIVDMIRAHQATSWCLIQSFEDDVLEKIHEIAPEIELHKLFLGNFLGIGLMRKSLDQYPHVTAFNSHYLLTSKRHIQKVHALGKKVNVWTVNKKSRIESMQHIGVDGIISDRPDYIIGI